MKVIRLAPAIAPVGEAAGAMPDAAVQLATAFAAVALPVLRRWDQAASEARAAAEQADAAVTKTDRALAEARVGMETGTSKLSGLRLAVDEGEEEIRKIDSKPWGFFRFLWMLIWGSGWRREREEAERVLARAREALAKAESTLSEYRGRIDAGETLLARERSRLQECRAEAARLTPSPKVVRGIAFLDYAWWPVLIQESSTPDGMRRKWLLVDAHGSPRELTIPVVKMSKEKMADLEEAIGGLDFTGILLDPREERSNFGAWDKLLGSEHDLREAANAISEFIRSVQPRKVSFSTIGNKTGTGRVLQDRGALIQQLTPKALPAALDSWTTSVLGGLEESATALRQAVGAKAQKTRMFYGRLAETAQRLREQVAQAKQDRAGSALFIGQRIRNSRLDSVLVRYHVFCPQCNAMPAHLEKRYEIHQEAIHELRTSELRPKVEKYLHQRLNSKEGKRYINSESAQRELEEGWTEAFIEFTQLENMVRQRDEEVAENEDSQDPQDRLYAKFAARDATNCRGWYREGFRTLLRNPFEPWEGILGGEARSTNGAKPASRTDSQRTPEIINPNTRLVYEPDEAKEPWSCPICSTKFSTEVALHGSVDRLRWDVVHPMIRSLWGQEAIWSKTLDALENAGREMRDRIEQEIKALQGPIDNFRADIRDLRGRLDDANARGRAIRQRLDEIVTEYERLGLLTGEQLGTVQSVRHGIGDRVERIQAVRAQLDVVEFELEMVIRKVGRQRQLPAPPERRFIEADAAIGLLGRRGLLQAEFSIDAVTTEGGGSPWFCTQCGQSNAAQGQFCGGCGAPR